MYLAGLPSPTPAAFYGVAFRQHRLPGLDGVVAPKKEAIPVPFRYPPDVDLAQYYLNRHTLPHMAWKVVLDPTKYGAPYNLEALMTYGGNPITNSSNPKKATAALSKIPFIVVIAYI